MHNHTGDIANAEFSHAFQNVALFSLRRADAPCVLHEYHPTRKNIDCPKSPCAFPAERQWRYDRSGYEESTDCGWLVPNPLIEHVNYHNLSPLIVLLYCLLQ